MSLPAHRGNHPQQTRSVAWLAHEMVARIQAWSSLVKASQAWSRLSFYLGCGIVALSSSVRAADPPRPNVLFIIVDDLNTSLGCYGNPVVRSPHIDRLAQRGMRFERAYSHYPICNPSRTALLTGKRPSTTRVFDNETPPRKFLPTSPVLPEYFRQHGYFTARVGKIAHGPYEPHFKWDLTDDPPRTGREREETWRAVAGADTEVPDGFTAPRVAKLLEQRKGGPFFVAVGFDRPHLPFIAPQKYFDLYPLDKIVLPKDPPNVRQGAPSIAFTSTRGEWDNEAQHRQVIAAYYACISFIDAQVGIILDALDRLGLTENTIVCFVSDHGFHLGERGGLWRKSTLFEESLRVPLIIASGQKTGVCGRVVELIDLFPTLVELCGLPKPPDLEGRSLRPWLDEPTAPSDKPAISFLIRETVLGPVIGQSIRTERWRYTDWGYRGKELYDHQTDPGEFINVVGAPQNAEMVKNLRGVLINIVPQPVIRPDYTRPALLGGTVCLLALGCVWLRRRKKR